MISALKLYLDIVLLRRGPEDVPASQALLVSTIALFAAVSVALRLVFPPSVAAWPVAMVVSIVFTLLWYGLVLRFAGKPERWMQVVTAVFGIGCLLTPLLAPLEAVLSRYVGTPEQAPGWIVLVLPLAIYVVYLNARILRAAIEQPIPLCIFIVVLQWLVEAMLVSLVLGPDAAPAVPAAAPAG
jgi:hypothetical protein